MRLSFHPFPSSSMHQNEQTMLILSILELVILGFRPLLQAYLSFERNIAIEIIGQVLMRKPHTENC